MEKLLKKLKKLVAKLTIKKLPVDKFNFTFLVDLITASEIFFYRMFFVL